MVRFKFIHYVDQKTIMGSNYKGIAEIKGL